ncbi:hypothetical protein TWF173_008300 [Orbilia oligospora]|nr:hypothetical protein TWF173_008300 [Orbilia oligospora]
MAAIALHCKYRSFPNARKYFPKQQTLLENDSKQPLFEPLSPGEARVYSFVQPGLPAGLYTISTKQTISAPSEPATGTTHSVQLPDKTAPPQQFKVVAPQFSLPNGAVHSVYPSQGRGAPVQTLPHIVFNDPYLPWEREVSRFPEGATERTKRKVPWLALLVFTADELRLQEEDLEGTSPLFQDAVFTKPVKQTETFAVEMKAGDLNHLSKETAAFTLPPDLDSEALEESTQAIFVPRSLFVELVTKYDKEGRLDENQSEADIFRYMYLAHVRSINTEGMANAAKEDNGLYSVVLSHRVGPLDKHEPTPVIAHLVSLEGIEKMSWPVNGNSKYVAIPSLHSWSYISLPPDFVGIREMMVHLGNTVDVLRVSPTVLDGLRVKYGKGGERVVNRLQDGYTLTKYRTQTGEVTAAMMRGPLTPNLVPDPLMSKWNRLKSLSNCGTDLQIIDQHLGVPDITYSAAWQLGKLLALADQGFCAALSRLRKQIQKFADNHSKADEARAKGAYLDHGEALATLPEAARFIRSIQEPNPIERSKAPDLVSRHFRYDAEQLDLSLNNPSISRNFVKHSKAISTKLASTSDGGPDDLYNELNKPYSTDWVVVLGWVLDRMYLDGIPAHYLIVDPSYLPKESLRFFNIDRNWIDSLVDGALSIGNLLEDDDDKVRTAIKESINRYLTTAIPGLNRTPQIPTYGYFLRSDMVSQFPDIKVEAPLPEGAIDTRAPILRQALLDNGIMMCLFDRVPASHEFDKLRFTQPPHQQSFIAGETVSLSKFETRYKRIYTVPDTKDRTKPFCDEGSWDNEDLKPDDQKSKNPPVPVFIWGGKDAPVRTLLLHTWADDVFSKLSEKLKNDALTSLFTDPYPTSTMTGIQLNNPIYELEISLKPLSPKVKSAQLAPEDVTLQMLAPTILSSARTTPISLQQSVLNLAALPIIALPTSNQASVGRTANPPPNHSVIPTMTNEDKAIVNATKGGGLQDFASQPQWSYMVYAMDDPSPQLRVNKHIQVNTDYLLDIVFSINLIPEAAAGTFDLQEIQVLIPMGKMRDPDDPHRATFLMENYTGPGATMLTNLRLNAMIERTDDLLVVRLIPRSVSKMIRFEKVETASFFLGMVDVNPYESDTVVTIEYLQYYDQFANPFRDTKDIILFKA